MAAGTVAVRSKNAVKPVPDGHRHYPDSLQDLLKKVGMCRARRKPTSGSVRSRLCHKKPGDAGRDFDIVFLGKDGKAGGEGQDKDYGSWEK